MNEKFHHRSIDVFVIYNIWIRLLTWPMMRFKWSFTLTLTWEGELILWTSEGDQICVCSSCNNSHVNDIYWTMMTAEDIHGARGIVMSRNDETNARNDVTHGTLHEFFPARLDPADCPNCTRLTQIPRLRWMSDDAEFFIILLSRCVDFKEKIVE